jgi:hypothetical protein
MKKEDLIYYHPNSLPTSLLPELSDNVQELEDCFNQRNTNSNVMKMKDVLHKEVQSKLYIYASFLSEKYGFPLLKNNEINTISKMRIFKNTYDGINHTPIFDQVRAHWEFDAIKVVQQLHCKRLFFVWFLNDFNGEILFWNDYYVRPTAGSLLIFPASWCFPFSEVVKHNETVSMITGYVYNSFVMK